MQGRHLEDVIWETPFGIRHLGRSHVENRYVGAAGLMVVAPIFGLVSAVAVSRCAPAWRPACDEAAVVGAALVLRFSPHNLKT